MLLLVLLLGKSTQLPLVSRHQPTFLLHMARGRWGTWRQNNSEKHI